MNATEMGLAARWIWETLTSDRAPDGIYSMVSDRVFEDAAPTAVQFPVIIFSLASEEDVTGGYGSTRLVSVLTYLVRAVSPGTGYASSGVDRIAARIDEVLHDASGHPVTHCLRERPFARSYDLDGVIYYERGGYYRLYVSGG